MPPPCVCIPIRTVALLAALVAAGALPAAAQVAAEPPEESPATMPLALPADEDPPARPAPAAADPASAAVFLDAARHAIATGQLAVAAEALEQAESRALTRAVPPSLAGRPSRQPVVTQIRAARTALGTGDRLRVLQLIDDASAAEAAEAH